MENNTAEFPVELIKIERDFIKDIQNTFPEFTNLFTEDELEYLKDEPDEKKLYNTVEYFKKVYPERFFDILYENAEMFDDESKNTKFFKNIDFKNIWNSNISDNTKNVIWKYLQLVLFSLSNNIEGIESFGETAKLFEAIDENELKTKLEEVVNSMGNIFDISGNNNFENEEFKKFMEGFMNENGNDFIHNDLSNVDLDDMFNKFSEYADMDISENEFKNMFENFMNPNDISNNIFNDENIPNPEDLHNHLNSIMEGKIGKLAQEIADETAKDLDIDTENISNIGDVFSKLFKNPGKLTNMIKKVSTKLDEKLKSGEIKKSELMQEANEIMQKLQSTPGMKGMEKMFSNMGGLGGKNTKLNMNLFKSMMERNAKQSSQKERMLRKLERRKMEKQLKEKMMQAQQANNNFNNEKEYNEYIQKTYNIDNTKMTKSKIKKKKKKKKGKKNKK
tara:strand:- start:9513 stop:10859 length:1347 start_codon:yes stop_codon:yes gene_type:complete